MGLASKLGNRFKAEFASQVLATASGAILIIALSNLLVPREYGLLFLSLSVLTFVKLLTSPGIANSAARYASEYKQKHSNQIPYILLYSFVILVALVMIVGTAFQFGSKYIIYFIDEPNLRPFLSIGVFFIIFSPLTRFTRIFSQGVEEIGLSATINATNRIGRLLFSLGFIFVGFGAVGALWGYVLAAVISSVFGLVILFVRYYKRRMMDETIENGLLKRILEYSIPLTLTEFSGKIDKQIDTILVGIILNPVAVSYYVLSKQISEFVQVPSNALGFSISPTYGKQKESDNLSNAARLFETSFIHTVLLYVPAAIGVALVAEPIVNMVFGNQYVEAVPVIRVMSLYIILSALTNITDHPLNYLGRAKIRAIAKGFASICNLGLNLLLIPTIGVVGAAAATVVTHSIYVIIKLYIVSIELPLNHSYLIHNMVKISIISLVMGAIVWISTQFIVGPITLMSVIMVGIFVWGTLSIMTGVINRSRIKIWMNSK